MPMLDPGFYLIVVLIGMALAFGFLSAFHDAADAIATVVSTRSLKPYQAVVLAACCNGIAILFFPLHVAAALASGTVEAVATDPQVVFGALAGAISWLLIAWVIGMPVSATHALIGSLLGAAVASGGSDALIASGVVKLLAFVLLTPLLGFALATLSMIVIAWLYVRSTPRRADKGFRRMQLLSAGLYNLGHGANNAQKCLGLIWMLLLAAGTLHSPDQPPYWTIVCSYAVVALGTLLGGWRVVKTMGQKFTHLKPVSGFCAEIGGALTLLLVNNLGIPVSPRQALTGAVIGVGSSRRMTAVRWGVATSMVSAWVLTIPASAFAGAVAWWVAREWM